jgi:mRNA-degrading endonuclease toxin of MazEF toxin-antitoxin module
MTEKKKPDKLLPEAIAKMQAHIEYLINTGESHNINKASLILYWRADYFGFLKKEETYDPRKSINYERGSIVKVHFGFRIGNEFGGLHYAVVLNNADSKSSGTLTVAPLKSKKDNAAIHWTCVDIGNEFFRKVISKHDTLMAEYERKIEALVTGLSNIASKHYTDAQNFGADEAESLLKNKYDLEKRCEQLRRLKREILRMKSGSIVLASQITTISKIRIYDPEHANQSLVGIKLEPTTLNMIDDKIKELFIYNK